jgi:hypothetical protein
MHLFTCTAPQQERLQQDLILYIAKQQHSKQMPAIAQLLEWSMTNCSHNEDWTVDKNLHPQELHKAIESQNAIGWNQIFYGRISQEFGRAQERFYRWRQLPATIYTGQRWTRDLIHKIWDTMLLLWQNRNKAKHDMTEQTQTQHTRQQLQEWVQHCYSQAHTISAADRNKLFQKTLEERLNEHPRKLQAWVASTEQILRINKLEDPHILKSRKKMEEFFQWGKKENRDQHGLIEKKNKTKT